MIYDLKLYIASYSLNKTFYLSNLLKNKIEGIKIINEIVNKLIIWVFEKVILFSKYAKIPSKINIVIKVIKIIKLIWLEDNKNKYFFVKTKIVISKIKQTKWLEISFNNKISNKTPYSRPIKYIK